MKQIALVFSVTVLLAACAGSKRPLGNTLTGDPRWIVVDSLIGLGQYASALERTDTILAEAMRSGDQRTEFKAWMRHAEYGAYVGMDEVVVLEEIGARAASAPVPLAQLLHSVRAEGWWDHYAENRWSILERTNLEGGGGDDANTWTQQRYMTEVIDAFEASIQPSDTLRMMPIGELGGLLTGDTGAYYLRPTLFDLLARRALVVFENTETRLSEPAWRFALDDARYFTLFEPFAMRPFKHRDSTAWEFRAIRIYQELERLHLSDDRMDAYVDVALDRLEYVHERSTLSDRDSLHLAALELLRTRLPKDACWSEVTLAIAQWHGRAATKYDRLQGDAWKWERKRAAELCDSAIARWPTSFGARRARAAKAVYERPELMVGCERAVRSEREFLVAVSCANVKEVWYRVVDAPTTERAEQTSLIERLLAQRPLQQGSFQWPDDGDLNTHVADLPMPALSFGAYTVLMCNSARFDPKLDVIAWCSTRVTNLAMTSRQKGTEVELLVLDRSTGFPKPGVKASTFVRAPADNGAERSIIAQQFVTDESGMVRASLEGRRGEMHWNVEHGKDQLRGNSFWVYPEYAGQPDSLRTFLFTDRAIYRPGQPIHVKGIVVVRRGKDNAIKSGHATRVYFQDTNGEFIDSLAVVTDPFGSFQGVFTAPVGRLTGQMRLIEAHGTTQVQVEEYKRPTFEAVFDAMATTPKLGEEATVTGVAKSYSGAPLDGATVKYTVKRAARMPWWCGWRYFGLPWRQEMEVAHGEVVCDDAGRFNVVFTAEGSAAFPRESDPSFLFTVDASVTDINGETQAASTSFAIGYRSIEPVISIGASLDRTKADSLVVYLANLNGERIDRPFDLKVTQLVRPAGSVKRSRLGARPDRFLLDAQEFASRFPVDVRDDENDPATWSRGVVVLDRKALSPKGRYVAFPGSRTLDVGTYSIELHALDPSGELVSATHIFTLYDPEVQRTGFENEAFHVEVVRSTCEPGEKAVLLISSALPTCSVLMEVERNERIAVQRRFTISAGQQRVELPVLETDRGGFAVHFVCVVDGRECTSTQWIDVPWSNKQLKVEWMSFRDKLLPGSKEEWRLKITGSKKEKVAAQVLAAMYDASLDVFVKPQWWMNVWEGNSSLRGWGPSEPFGSEGGQNNSWGLWMAPDSTRDYPRLSEGLVQRRMQWRYDMTASPASINANGGDIPSDGRADGGFAHTRSTIREGTFKDFEGEEDKNAGREERPTEPSVGPVNALRTDFRETAFFLPDQLTDNDGNVVLRFTMPDALTRWNLMGLAHTRDLRTARFDRSAITQKPLMVTPNLPRFLRQGDRIVITAKINVVDGAKVTGTATIELVDPRTNRTLSSGFNLNKTTRPFAASVGSSANVSWELKVPTDLDAVLVRISATGLGVGDGEERLLPILSDKMLVTESVPLWISKAGTKSFSLPTLLASGSSRSLQHRALTLEYTPNPAWCAVQALPYLMEFPHECAEQTFSRYFANHLAWWIVRERPAIKKVFDGWSKGTPGNEGAFLSALEKNPELKAVLLEETPWVMNAKDEGERKRRIALFFDLHRMAEEDATALKKLGEVQLPTGAWSWWSGMQPSRTITQHIVSGFGHLQQLDALNIDPNSAERRMLRRAVEWLDKQVEEDHQRMLRENKRDSLTLPSADDIHYIYARSFYPQYPLERKKSSAAAFILERARASWTRYGIQEQAMIAIALHRMVDEETPTLITTSLAQRASYSEELGMYWKDFRPGLAWNTLPAETHALMVEAFELVARDRDKVNALRHHLLKLKQTTDWRTTKATADACYALLLTGDDLLTPMGEPLIELGGREVRAGKNEAGTGYFQRSWPGEEVVPAMGEVTVTTKEDGVQWGALYWQYLERMDKVVAQESPFSLRRQVMLSENTDTGARSTALTEARPLKPGDKLTVRVELRTDRYLDHVHLKDLRAAGLEPMQALSGYEWKGGLGYYRSIRDASMHFFFDRLAPGTYVFEYDLKVTHAGDFSNGITSAQCMYAPEFSSHSEGVLIKVGE